MGVAKDRESSHGLYFRGELSVAGQLKIVAQKIGAQYRERFNYNILDLFGRNLPDGSTNFGLSLEKAVNKAWLINVKGDYTTPGPLFTAELIVGNKISVNSTLELTCRYYKKASDVSSLVEVGVRQLL
ncbi:hypothetical protein HZB08_03145 [Candidatus Saganbacteria bacterium]|uniref:Uncharacterized protein n=1 Tax=Candidatus Saganbacteria bacterium TaxID=2575572 RepID=A0A9D6UMH0_UNCSA|nr:hypothetical protein [Candidatus Saganbacteria bacterium]